LELKIKCSVLVTDQIIFRTHQVEIPLRACAAANPEVEAS